MRKKKQAPCPSKFKPLKPLRFTTIPKDERKFIKTINSLDSAHSSRSVRSRDLSPAPQIEPADRDTPVWAPGGSDSTNGARTPNPLNTNPFGDNDSLNSLPARNSPLMSSGGSGFGNSPSPEGKLNRLNLESKGDETDLNTLILSDDDMQCRPTSPISDHEDILWRVSWREGVSIRAEPDEGGTLLGVLEFGTKVRATQRKELWIRHARGWSPIWDPFTEAVMMKKVTGEGGPPKVMAQPPANAITPATLRSPMHHNRPRNRSLGGPIRAIYEMNNSDQAYLYPGLGDYKSLTAKKISSETAEAKARTKRSPALATGLHAHIRHVQELNSPPSLQGLSQQYSASALDTGLERLAGRIAREAEEDDEEDGNDGDVSGRSGSCSASNSARGVAQSNIFTSERGVTQSDIFVRAGQRWKESQKDKTEIDLPPPLPLFVVPLTKRKDGLPNHLGLPMMKCPKFNFKSPDKPEPFYISKGGSQKDLISRCKKTFLQRIATATGSPNIVYDSLKKPPGAGEDYNRPDTSGRLTPYYTPKSPDDITLVFESRFESGNLRRAIKVSEGEYDLMCRPDINTNSYAQWFFFSISNTRVKRYKFNIINMLKSDSLFNQGMKPVIYSLTEEKKSGQAWVHKGFDICYYRNSKKYHTATFTLHSDYNHDTIYIAYCYPYTYTDLQTDIQKIEEDQTMSQYVRRRVLCRTLADNSCDVLTVTDFNCSQEKMKAKRAIIVSARVHPGESNASWMMRGIIHFLVGRSSKAATLRKRFLFKIIPMLNPDGVILGNYRCGLAGHDLNRNWAFPSTKLHPTIVHIKNLIKRLAVERELLLTTDLHGHSKAMNVFMYGCNNNHDPDRRLEERVFPRMLSESSESFAFEGCHFKVRKEKSGSARVVVWKETGIIMSYTMEASFAGSNQGKNKGNHFTIESLMEMGRAWCRNILDYEDKKIRGKAKASLEKMYPRPAAGQPLEDIDGDDASGDDSADSAEERPPDPGETFLGMDMSCAVKANLDGNVRVSKQDDHEEDDEEEGGEDRGQARGGRRRRNRTRKHVRGKSTDSHSTGLRSARKKYPLYPQPKKVQPQRKQPSPGELARKNKERGWNRPAVAAVAMPKKTNKKSFVRDKARKTRSLSRLSSTTSTVVRKPSPPAPAPPVPLKGMYFSFDFAQGCVPNRTVNRSPPLARPAPHARRARQSIGSPPKRTGAAPRTQSLARRDSAQSLVRRDSSVGWPCKLSPQEPPRRFVTMMGSHQPGSSSLFPTFFAYLSLHHFFRLAHKGVRRASPLAVRTCKQSTGS